MPELSIQNIERISRDVKKQEIVFSHLLDELIDHICCDVENEMQDGLNFLEAYSKVRQKISSRRIKEIQEETLYAVDTKYRHMKRTMKISGVAGTIIFGCAAMFKIQHWPGAGIMLTLGALILTFVFMPSALGVLWKETHSGKKILLFLSAFFSAGFFITGILFKIQHWNGAATFLIMTGVTVVFLLIPSILAAGLRDPENKQERPVYIAGAIGLTAFFSGFLFKIMHWQGAMVLLLFGLSVIFIIVLPWYTWLKWKDEKTIKPEFIFIIAGSLAILLPSTLLNLNLQRSFDEGFYNNLEEQQALYDFMFQNKDEFIDSYHDSLSWPMMQRLDSVTVGLLGVIASVEEKMVGESEGEPGNPVENPSQIKHTQNGAKIDYRLLTNPFDSSPVRNFLVPGADSRNTIETAATEYSKYLSSIIPPDKLVNIVKAINPSTYITVQGDGNLSISLMSGLHSLAVMKNSLLTVEHYALKELTGIR
jgi:hypothetical protein